MRSLGIWIFRFDKVYKGCGEGILSLEMEEEKDKEISGIEENKNNFQNHKINNNKNKNFKEKIKEKTLSFLKDKYNLAFLVILVLAFLIRLKYINQESIWNDAAVHLWNAIRVTKDPLFFFNPEYLQGDYVTIQTLVALIYLFTKNAFLAGKTVALLFGVVGIIFIYLLGAELKSRFIGLLSAALLGFQHLFWFYGVRPLADGPLTAMVVVALYGVVKLEKEKTLSWGFFALFSFLALMLTKGQGVLFYIAFLIYLVVFKRKEAIKSKAMLIAWLVPVILIFLGSLILRQNLAFRFTARFTDPRGLAGLRYEGLNALANFPWVFSWYLLIPIIIGLLLILAYRKREYYFLIISFLFYWLFFELTVGTPLDRYMMPLLPVGILFAAFALEELSSYLLLFIKKKYLTRFLVIIFVVFICWHFYDIGDPLIYQKSFTYIGYEEAGGWLKENVPEGLPIFAGSPRSIRVFVEREYGGPPNSQGDLGGSIWFLRDIKYQENKTAFEGDVANLVKKSDLYLEVDIWEYTQPKWYYPISQDSLNYFMGLGFQPVKIVEREVPAQQGLQKMPVIFILRKEKE